MLILTEQQIRSIYSIDEAIRDLEKAIHLYTDGKIVNPPRTVLNFPEKSASVLYMPCAMEPVGKASIKVVTIFPNNPSKGKKTTQGVLLLSDTESGDLIACLNASYLTRLRTGAVSGIATKYLAKETASSVAVIGCGAMAEEQLQAVLEVRNIQEIRLINRTTAKAHSFAEKIIELKPDYKGSITVMEDANQAVTKSEIVICSTRSELPVFSGEILQPGTHINGIGSYLPHMREVDEETLVKCSKIVADTTKGVMEEAGDFLIPVKAGKWSFDNLYGEIGDLVSGKIKGRENNEEITFFKSVGIAYFDLAVAAAVYEKAIQVGVGTRVPSQ